MIDESIEEKARMTFIDYFILVLLKSYQDLSMEFVKYIHKSFKRLFCQCMRVKYTTIINNISDDFLLLDNEMELYM